VAQVCMNNSAPRTAKNISHKKNAQKKLPNVRMY
jgi:hypothetical protein